MKEEYLSISEFARRAGVSRQAIQQRLDSSLREYVKIAQGKKIINSEGLKLFDGARLAQGFDKTCQDSKDIDPAIIELLKAELEAKDQQIERLQKLLEQQQKLFDQEQQLHAATTQRLLLLEKPKEEPAQPDPDNDEAPTQRLTPDMRPPQREEEQPRKWWPFGWKKKKGL